jgi:hypothetical protein
LHGGAIVTNPVTKDEFEAHAHAEEANQRMVSEALSEGNKRMAAIETDLKPLLKLYHAVLGAGAVLGFVAILLTFIYQGDREQAAATSQAVKTVTEAVAKQGVVLEKLILRHEELEKDTDKAIERIEKKMEKR